VEIQLNLNQENNLLIILIKLLEQTILLLSFLCALLKNDLDEKTFSCAFMMLTLDAFIAPNGYGSASTA
jgi:hypothetical protein